MSLLLARRPKTYTDIVYGSASDSTPVVVPGGRVLSWLQSRGKRSAHVGIVAPAYASAGPTGSIVESWSVSAASVLAPPVETRIVAVRTARTRNAQLRHSTVRAPAPPVVNVDVVSGSASASGSVVEAWSVLSLSQMTIQVRRPADLLRRKARVRYQHRLTVNAGIVFLTDAPVGSASPSGSIVEQKVYTESLSGGASASGSIVEAWSVLSLGQMTVRIVRASDRLKRKGRVRYQHRLTLNAGITTTSDAPSGSASSSGSLVESKTGTDSVSGSAAATGTIVESSSVLTLGQMTIRVRRAADLIKRNLRVRYEHRLTRIGGVTTVADAPTGFASPSGSISESLSHASSTSGTAASTSALADALSHASSPSGTALPSGTSSDQDTGDSTVTGGAGASGALSESRIGSDAVTGSAAPSGSIVEQSFRGFADAPSGSASPSGSATDAATHASSPTGTSSATGSATDDFAPPAPSGPIPGPGGVPEAIRLARLQRARLYLDSPVGYAAPIGYVQERHLVMPVISTQLDDEDELLLLGLL